MGHTSLFDIDTVPFSTYGSWMSLRVPPGESGIFVRNHHMRPNNLFVIRLHKKHQRQPVEADATPARLVLRADAGMVEICFETPDSLRMRGKGVGISFAGEHIVAYENGENRAVFNIRRAFRRYQFDVLRGSLALRGAYASQQEDLENLSEIHGDGVFEAAEAPDAGKQVLEVLPDADGQWELAIDEFWSSWQEPATRPSFDECLQQARQHFEAFRDSMPKAAESLSEARDLASYINWSCTMNPCGLVKRPTLFMSKNWMNNVWSWDQCFNAMALAQGQPQLALDQMLTLVDHQDAYGAYTDAFNDMEMHYNYSKPPVHGFAYRELLQQLPGKLESDIRETMYVSLARQANWWMTYRCFGTPGLGSLPYYLHGNDSGWDNSTMFAKGVPLVAPDLAALLVIQMDVLSDLAQKLDRTAEAADWRQRADALFALLIQELWQEDRFVARLAHAGTPVDSASLIPCLPLMLGTRLPANIRAALRDNLQQHLTEWGLATERIDSPQYLPDGYWRGPIWAPSTYLAVVGLERSGFPELANEIAHRFCRLCDKSGFAENFDATTGAPLRDPAYTWTASVFLLLSERIVRDL